MNKQELIEIMESIVTRHSNDGECPNVAVYNAYINSLGWIKKLDEPQKPVLPKFVADWIEKTKRGGRDTPFAALVLAKGEVQEWLIDPDNYLDNQEAFVRAWLDGYEVEKEPLYRVIMPNPQAKNGNVLVLRRTQQGTITVNKVKAFTALHGEGLDLTEDEIKSVDERYWAFAVPVEEVVEENE